MVTDAGRNHRSIHHNFHQQHQQHIILLEGRNRRSTMDDMQLLPAGGIDVENNHQTLAVSTSKPSSSSSSSDILSYIPFLNAIRDLFLDGFLAISDIHQQKTTDKLETMFEEDEESEIDNDDEHDGGGGGVDACHNVCLSMATGQSSFTASNYSLLTYQNAVCQDETQLPQELLPPQDIRRRSSGRTMRRHHKKKKTHNSSSSRSHHQSSTPETLQQQRRPLAIATGFNVLQDMEGRNVIITP